MTSMENQAKRVAVIKDGAVVNVILAKDGFEVEGYTLIASDTAQIGQSWDGENFSDPPAPPAPVPQSISDRQFFQALALSGQITEAEALAAVKDGTMPEAIETFIAALPEAERFGARMLLQGATTFERNHPLVSAFASAANMTADATDDLWRLAASL